ncbi:hypothetical protein Fcan01_01157 [Folsomia candida]|uniref:Uncharacterized protein n=1 Tax=Folsomia candida TaxID=158441 RepID=A0A226F386_FOLCA|nr:hypothetical protein Fcan01_01157 [Folsomia candida]
MWNFSVDTNIFVVLMNLQMPNSLIIIELYSIKSRFIVQEVMNQDETFEGFTIGGLSNRRRRLNFQGELIRSIIYKVPTRRFVTTIALLTEALNDLIVILNFTKSFLYGDSWIKFDAYGKPLGIAKLIENDEGDVLAQGHELSLERQAKLDFLFPNYNFREMAFFKQPETFYPNLIFQPYAVDAWISFLISLGSISICICTVAYFCGEINRICECIILKVLGLFAQQGWSDKMDYYPHTFPLKLTILAGLILSGFFYNLYSARIVSIISLRDPPIKTMSQIVSSGVKIFVDSEATNSHRFIEKFTHQSKNESIISTEDGMRAVIDDLPLVFLTFRHYVVQTMAVGNLTFQTFCDTISSIELDVKGLPVYNGMYVKKHSPLRKFFLYAHIRRAEIGAIHRQTIKFYKIVNPGCLNVKGNVESLDIGVVLPVFVVSLSISVLAFVSLDPHPVTIVLNSDYTMVPSTLSGVPYFISVSYNVTASFCDKGLRNGSGILLLNPPDFTAAVKLLSQLNELESQYCDYGRYNPKKVPTVRYFHSISLVTESLDDLITVLNFTTSFVFGDSWIQFDASGKPLGIAKVLENDEGDILAQVHELTLARQAKLDFLFPNYNYREMMFLKQPETFYPNLIFQPYGVNAWFAFLVSVGFISICVYTVAYFSGETSRICECIILKVFGLFAQQGWTDKMDAFPLKLTILAGLILSTFFYNLYSARIISIISLREPPIKTMSQILSSGIKILVDSEAANALQFVDKFTDQNKNESIISTEGGMRAVIDNLPISFLTFRHYVTQTKAVENLTFQAFCDTISSIELDVKGLPVYNGIHIRRAEMGAIYRQSIQFNKVVNPRCFNVKGNVESLDIGVVLPVFVVSFSISVLAFFSLVYEIVLDYVTRSVKSLLVK